jgi:hypothetical protein
MQSSTKKPYLDVISVRNGHSVNVLGSSSEPSPQKSLLKEPVCVPYMSHIDVQKEESEWNSTLFYPSGAKNITMKRTIETSLKKSANFPVQLKSPSIQSPKRRPKATVGSPHPNFGSKLFFSRSPSKGKDDEIRAIIAQSRKREVDFDSIIINEGNATVMPQ